MTTSEVNKDSILLAYEESIKDIKAAGDLSDLDKIFFGTYEKLLNAEIMKLEKEMGEIE